MLMPCSPAEGSRDLLGSAIGGCCFFLESICGGTTCVGIILRRSTLNSSVSSDIK